ncbi:MAG: hypothetical protein KBD06_00940 [Candidatus Pacebacteria bacterium]|nr:hypothetical protein [Candidatus Paceibacterota bacterium]
MKVIVVIVLVLIVATSYTAFSFTRKVRVSTELTRNTIPFTLKGPPTVSLLVLGDSTAVGVGARVKEESLAALFADTIHATNVENRAVSGARVRNVVSQTETATERAYTYILLGIGANDIVRLQSAEAAAAELRDALARLPKRDHLIVYSAGNVGGTQLFPRLINPLYTKITLEYHNAFKSVVEVEGGIYVNLYESPENDPFIRDPVRYFADDGFHPSSAGYRVWHEKIIAMLQ